jgi:photosystem II stability/assembly factor-like uncharacterized protein
MKKILLILFFLLLSRNIFGQDWIKINPTFEPFGNYNTYECFFLNDKDGWLLSGPNRNIWHTSDYGIYWSLIQEGEKGASYIQFVDTLHGWFGGETLPEHDYYITKTKDGGKNWEEYSTPKISCITFLDSLNGFGGEYFIYTTRDGGITWQQQEVADSLRALVLEDIYFVDSKNGWAVGGSSRYWDAGIILNTKDGGNSWKASEHPSGIYGNAVYFTDSLHGYVAGTNLPYYGGAIKATNNGGKSWQVTYLDCPILNDIVFTNDSTGWAIGDKGYIWYTNDRGKSWTQVESETTSDLYRIFFFTKGAIGYIFGENSTLLKYDKTVNVNYNTPLIPSTFKLYQNYPNPFNPITYIDYDIPKSGLLSLTIYDLLGKKIKTLSNEEKQPGSYSMTWDGDNEYGQKVSSGIYFYQLRTEFYTKTLKMILLK